MTRQSQAVLLRNEGYEAQEMLRAGVSTLEDLERWRDQNGIIGCRNLPEASFLPDRWTTDHLAQRLLDAVATMEKMQGPKKPRAPGNNWVEYQYEFADRVGWSTLPDAEQRARNYEAMRIVADKPTSREIAQMEMCQELMRGLRQQIPALGRVLSKWVVSRHLNRNIKEMCLAEGWSFSNFYKWREDALTVLAAQLNRKAVAVF